KDDAVLLRVIVSGEKDGEPATYQYEMTTVKDRKNDVTAMARATANTISVVAQMIGNGTITKRGVYPPEEIVPGKRYIDEMKKRDVIIKESSTVKKESLRMYKIAKRADFTCPLVILAKGWHKVIITMNKSVHKALKLLDLFTEDEPEMTLRTIASRANIPKPTAYRLLTTLEAAGFLDKAKLSEHDSRYRLGLKLLELGSLVSERHELREVARPYMEKLANVIHELVHLVIVNNNKAVYIEKVDSSRTLRLYTRIGRSLPLYIGSGPKLLLAHLSVEKRNAIINQSKQSKYANGQRVCSRFLDYELEQIREQGYSYSVGEQDADTTGLSYPILNHHNRVVAALAVSGLSSHFTGKNLERIKKQTKETAKNISQQLGYRNGEDKK